MRITVPDRTVSPVSAELSTREHVFGGTTNLGGFFTASFDGLFSARIGPESSGPGPVTTVVGGRWVRPGPGGSIVDSAETYWSGSFLEDSSTGLEMLTAPAATYRPGRQYRQIWNRAVFAPAFGVTTRDPDDTMFVFPAGRQLQRRAGRACGRRAGAGGPRPGLGLGRRPVRRRVAGSCRCATNHVRAGRQCARVRTAAAARPAPLPVCSV
ncbi:hypothetical protein Dvina_31960 [Dactylosporangium vinaceum]|uniref:Uncharacterized protein n=1 Tax=Dactylosporangium vinaceum TaxID=53362 RepID=A0ABV5MAP8_9ACTN|nr:hypothetical protein [Dactylosporangium vinaceum]UAB92912.1 hypothetical protein Dvina_31960 [Dactylosporangium vinaceum]